MVAAFRYKDGSIPGLGVRWIEMAIISRPGLDV